jgi:hypothetical protein
MGRRKKYQEEPLETKAPIRQARFFVAGGNYNPSGYRCGNVEIMRQRGESTEELRGRCRDSFPWPDADTVHVFMPIN